MRRSHQSKGREMNKTTAALKLAEEALHAELESDTCEEFAEAAEKCHKALAAIREALAEQEKQEPVYAFRRRGLDDFCTCTKERYEELVDKPNLFEVTTFYTAPVSAKREWVDLTDDDLRICFTSTNTAEPLSEGWNGLERFARAIIATFKEKNT